MVTTFIINCISVTVLIIIVCWAVVYASCPLHRQDRRVPERRPLFNRDDDVDVESALSLLPPDPAPEQHSSDESDRAPPHNQTTRQGRQRIRPVPREEPRQSNARRWDPQPDEIPRAVPSVTLSGFHYGPMDRVLADRVFTIIGSIMTEISLADPERTYAINLRDISARLQIIHRNLGDLLSELKKPAVVNVIRTLEQDDDRRTILSDESDESDEDHLFFCPATYVYGLLGEIKRVCDELEQTVNGSQSYADAFGSMDIMFALESIKILCDNVLHRWRTTVGDTR